jgi:hypothetical protein
VEAARLAVPERVLFWAAGLAASRADHCLAGHVCPVLHI